MKQKFRFLLFIIICGSLAFATTSASPKKAPQPKYIFLFIGDGMGLAHVTAAENYLAAKQGFHGSDNLSFTSFPVMGLATTFSANTLVTCSSAAATALATGNKTNNGMLGVSPDGNRLTAITYPLHNAGYKIGIATSVSIDHATPAGFYGSDTSRNNYYNIAWQASVTNFDFFAGSGFINPTGKNDDQPNVYGILENAGYRIVRGAQGAAQITVGSGKTVLVQDEGKSQISLPYAIDRQDDDLTLSQITTATINALQNKKGFFAMIEGGKIDWAAHSNDGATVIQEVIDFSDAVKIAFDFYKKYPNETLIIVTADHETGGMSVGSRGKYAFNPLVFDEQKQSLSDDPSKREYDFVRALNDKALCGWTSRSHTGIMVPVYAIGVGSERFAGKIDNTDIPKRILELVNISF